MVNVTTHIKRIPVEWHGTWRPIETFHYDPISDLLGPEIEMVGVEMRCGKVYKATPSGFRAADRHELKCQVCRSYKSN